MARLSAQAELGFVPTPTEVATALLSYVAAPDAFTGRIVDPCAGKGVMIGAWAARFGIDTAHVYLNELHDSRAEACAAQSDHVLACDALKSLQATPGFGQFCWLNPPYDADGAEEGGGRLEPKFFRRVVEEGKWVQTGGIVAILSPQDVLLRQECRNHLARCYDDLTIWALPPAHRRYREVVVFGVVRASWRVGKEQKDEAERLKTLLVADLPVLTIQPASCYILPAPRPVKRIVWRDASRGTTVIAQQDVVKGGGAWASKRYRVAANKMDRTTPVPLFPLTKSQAALRIANGLINGETVALNGVAQEIKGSTVEEEHTWVEERETGTSHVVERHKIVRRAPHVTTIDGGGRIRRYVGDKGIARLMGTPGATEVLLQAVKRKAPPLYQLDMTPDVAALLQTITPASGRALPGYRPGLLVMQKHVVAAAHRALTTYNPSHGRVPVSVIINAEMGGGKCLAEGTLIPTDRGLVPIEQLMPLGTQEEEFAPLNMTIQTPDGPRTTSHFYNSGIRPTKQITTRYGYRLAGTLVHPVLVLSQDGQRVWKQLWDVVPGDYVAIQRHGQVWGSVTELAMFSYQQRGNSCSYKARPLNLPTHMTPDLAYVMGVILGDGSMRATGQVKLTTADTGIAQTVGAFVARLGAHLVKAPWHPYEYFVTSVIFKAWLNHLGITNVKTDCKVVPYTVMQAPQACVRAFLQGLFDTDGSALKTGNVEYCSASSQLAWQVHLLLLQFGIIAALRYKPNDKAGVWVIKINGAEAKRFYARIGFRLERKQVRATRLSEVSNSNRDVVPHLPPFSFDRVPRDFRMYIRRLQAPGYAKLRQMAKAYRELQELTSPEFFWDKVVAVENAGLQRCYDLTVPKIHSFVSNGIVSHNTTIGLALAELLRQLAPTNHRSTKRRR